MKLSVRSSSSKTKTRSVSLSRTTWPGWGFRFWSPPTAWEPSSTFWTTPIAAIVTDYRMDILGGDYWVRFLERFCPGQKILVTSGFLKSDLHHPFEVLTKPYSFAELEAKLRDMLSANHPQISRPGVRESLRESE